MTFYFFIMPRTELCMYSKSYILQRSKDAKVLNCHILLAMDAEEGRQADRQRVQYAHFAASAAAKCQSLNALRPDGGSVRTMPAPPGGIPGQNDLFRCATRCVQRKCISQMIKLLTATMYVTYSIALGFCHTAAVPPPSGSCGGSV